VDIQQYIQVDLPRLLKALDQSGTREVLDLCSGGGGPRAGLVKEFQGDEGVNIGICLSDKYPNRVAFERAHTTEHRVGFEPRSVDAMRVPDDLAVPGEPEHQQRKDYAHEFRVPTGRGGGASYSISHLYLAHCNSGQVEWALELEIAKSVQELLTVG
jgi:hypothetical protein